MPGAAVPSGPSRVDRSLTVALAAVAVAFDRFRLATARGLLGVGNTEMLALTVVALYGPITPGELADRIGLTTTSATGLLDRLEAERLAQRHRHPTDRRKLVVELSAIGHAAIRVYLERITGVIDDSVSRLSDADRATLSSFLRGVTNGLREVPGPAPARPRVEPDAGGGSVVFLEGELDVARVSGLGSWLADLLADGHGALTVDLTEVSFLASAGVAVLAELQDRHPGRVRLQAPPDGHAGRVLTLVGLLPAQPAAPGRD